MKGSNAITKLPTTTRDGHRDWRTQKKTNTYQQTYSLRHSILNSTIVYSKEKQVTLQRMKTNIEGRRVHDGSAEKETGHMNDRSTEEKQDEEGDRHRLIRRHRHLRQTHD